MKNKSYKSSIPEIPVSALEAAFESLGSKPPARSPEQGIAITKACIAETEAELESVLKSLADLHPDNSHSAEEHHTTLIRELRSLRLQLASYEMQYQAQN